MGIKPRRYKVKYMLRYDLKIFGRAEKHDVLGALYGYTKEISSDNPDMPVDLSLLQNEEKIDRIAVNLNKEEGDGHLKGSIKIPIHSNMDEENLSYLAAALELLDQVGPTKAEIIISSIDDVREERKSNIEARAASIKKRFNMGAKRSSNETMSSEEEKHKSSKPLRKEKGKKAVVKLSPDSSTESIFGGNRFKTSSEVYIVEGRADIRNLSKFNLFNTIAVNGTNVSSILKYLEKKDRLIIFLDGDRGGDLLCLELIERVGQKIVGVIRAPERKEVENLSEEEVKQCLKNSSSLHEAKWMTGTNKGTTFVDPSADSNRVNMDSKNLQTDDSTAKQLESKPTVKQLNNQNGSTRKKSPKSRDSRLNKGRSGRSSSNNRSYKKTEKYEKVLTPLILDTIKKVRSNEITVLVNKEGNFECEFTLKDTFDGLSEFLSRDREEGIDGCVIVTDGVVSNRLADLLKSHKIKTVIGAKFSDSLELSFLKKSLTLLTFSQIRKITA